MAWEGRWAFGPFLGDAFAGLRRASHLVGPSAEEPCGSGADQQPTGVVRCIVQRPRTRHSAHTAQAWPPAMQPCGKNRKKKKKKLELQVQLELEWPRRWDAFDSSKLTAAGLGWAAKRGAPTHAWRLRSRGGATPAKAKESATLTAAWPASW